MTQEIKNYQNNSNKIPFFNATGSVPDNRLIASLPPFNNAANNMESSHVHKWPEQYSNSNYMKMQPDAQILLL